MSMRMKMGTKMSMTNASENENVIVTLICHSHLH